MRRSDKHHHEFDEFTKPFLPDESVESTVAVAIELRTKLLKVEQQVLAQYTAMASYATIAQQNVDACRAESRADLDRMQATLIGLLEKLRSEMLARLSGADHRAAPMQSLTVDGATRLAALEDQVASMAGALEIYARENAELKSRLADMVERKLENEGWLASDASAGELSLL
jgi:hypothetical protein